MLARERGDERAEHARTAEQQENLRQLEAEQRRDIARGMSGGSISLPSNSSRQGFSKKCENISMACNGLSGLTTLHGQISAITA